MSDATKAAFEAALEAHIADEGDGHLLAGYAIIAAGVNTTNLDNKSTHYFVEYAEGQPYHASLGLAHQLADEVKEWFMDREEDDDDV